MGFRIEGREPGPNDKLSKTGWPVAEQAAATSTGAPAEPQPALVQLVSDIGGRLMHWAKGDAAAKPAPLTAQPLPEHADLYSPPAMIEPSRCHRAAPAVRDETDSPEAMIKPSRCHRAAIEAHRDDWP